MCLLIVRIFLNHNIVKMDKERQARLEDKRKSEQEVSSEEEEGERKSDGEEKMEVV